MSETAFNQHLLLLPEVPAQHPHLEACQCCLKGPCGIQALLVGAQHKGEEPLDAVVWLGILLDTQLLYVASTGCLSALAVPAAVVLSGMARQVCTGQGVQLTTTWPARFSQVGPGALLPHLYSARPSPLSGRSGACWSIGKGHLWC